MMAPLFLLGPLAGVLVGSEPTVGMLLDHARIAETQRCLAGEHRARVRRGEAIEDRWWPFATGPLEAEEDAGRCGMR